MAINTGQPENTQPQAAPMSAAMGQPQPQVQPQDPLRLKGGASNLNALFRRPFSRNTSAEVVTDYINAFKKYLENDANGQQFRGAFRLYPIDHNLVNLPLSIIAFTLEAQTAKGLEVIVYSMIVEASDGPLARRRIEQGHGQFVEVDVTASDIYNDSTWQVIKRHLQDQYGNTNAQFISAGAVVLPRELNLENKSDLYRVFYYGTAAMYEMMAQSNPNPDRPVFNFDLLKGTPIRGMLETRPARLTAVGDLPIRNDLAVATEYLTRSEGMLGGAPMEKSNPLTYVGGYMDLDVLDIRARQQNMNPWQAQQDLRMFAPRYVQTYSDTAIDAISLEMVCFNILTSTLVAQNWNWMQAFRPNRVTGKQGKGTVNWRDIGALGYVVPFAGPDKFEKVDTTGAFGDQELANLLQTAVVDDVIISMDVEDTGGISWLHQVFLNSRYSQNAYNMVLRAFDNLTCGQFIPMWNAAGGTMNDIVRDEHMRVHFGYFIGADDERHDLRELDRLAMYNLFGGRDQAVLLDWDRSWYDTTMGPERQLEIRRNIYENLLTGTVIKGHMRRITFTKKLLECLVNASKQAGGVIQQVNVQMFGGTNQQRPFYSMDGVGIQGAHGFNAGVFNAGPTHTGYTAAPSSFMGVFGHR